MQVFPFPAVTADGQVENGGWAEGRWQMAFCPQVLYLRASHASQPALKQEFDQGGNEGTKGRGDDDGGGEHGVWKRGVGENEGEARV